MKRQTNSMRIGSIILAFAAVLALSACKDFFQLFEPQQRGSITVATNGADDFGAKTLRPIAGDLTIDTYYYHLVGPGGVVVDGSDSSGTKTFADLIVGSWTVAVTAKNTSAVTLLASAAVPFTISQGQASSVEVPLVASDGTGTVSVTLALPAFVTQVTGTRDDNANPGNPVDINAKIAFTPPNAVYTDTLNDGTYLLVLSLKNAQGNLVGMVIEDMDVFAGVPTTVTLPVRDIDLTQTPVAPSSLTATAGDGQASLEYASIVGATGYKVYYTVNSDTATTADTLAVGSPFTNLSPTITGLYKGTKYAFVVTAINFAGESAASTVATITTPGLTTYGLVAEYLFSGNANDTSGNGNDGTVNGTTPIEDRFGNSSKAFSFDGNNDYIEFSQAFIFNLDTDASLSFWYARDEDDHQTLFNSHDPVDGSPGGNVSISCGSLGGGSIYNIGVGFAVVDTTGRQFGGSLEPSGWATLGTAIGQWSHIALIRHLSNYKLFCDGILLIDITDAAPSLPVYQGSWRIGWRNYFQYMLNGKMDDLRIYNRALSESEIQALYQDGDWLGYPAAPSGLNASAISNAIRLTWTDNSDNETGFLIERSLDGSTGWTGIGTASANATTYDDSGAAIGVRYYYRVKATNAYSDSGYANTASCSFNGTAAWAKTYGGTGDEAGNSIKRIGDNYYIIGHTTSYGAGMTDGLIIKLDISGNIIWQKSYGGSNPDELYGLIETSDGNIMVSGWTQSFGTAIGNNDGWIMKLDKNGTVLWQKTYGSAAANDGFYQIIETFDGNYIATIATSSWGQGGIYYGQDAWIVKLDPAGNVIWEKAIGNSAGNDHFNSVIETSDHKLVFAGDHNGLAGIVGRLWVVKMEENGDILWQKEYGGPNDTGQSIIETTDHCYVVAGITSAYGAGSADGWMLKLDTNGNIIWQKAFGSSYDDGFGSLAVNNDNSILVSGYYGSTAINNGEIWLLKLAADGTILHQKTIGGPQEDIVNRSVGIILGTDGYVFPGRTSSFGSGGQELLLLKTDTALNCPPLTQTVTSTVTDTPSSAVTTDGIVTVTNCTIMNSTCVPADISFTVQQQAGDPKGSSGFTMTGGLLQDYAVNFTVTGAQTIPAPNTAGYYPIYTISQAMLPITVSVSSTPTASSFQWLLNGTLQASATSSIELTTLNIRNHTLTLRLKNGTDAYRSATIILKATN